MNVNCHPHDGHDHAGAHRDWVRPDGTRGCWLEPFLLRLVAEGQVHGSALIAHVNALCPAPDGVDEGMTYRTLRELEVEGLVDSTWVLCEGPPMHIYRLTGEGRQALEELIGVMSESDRLSDAFPDGANCLDEGERVNRG